MREALGVAGDLRTVRRVEVVSHAVVEGKEGGGRANLSTHVANCRHASAREGVNTGAGVLDDSAGTTLDGQDSGDLEDDVCGLFVCLHSRIGGDEPTLGCRPAANLTGKVDLDDLGALQLPRNAGHNVYSVGTTDTASDHTKTASVGGMRVCTDHKTTGECVIFKDNLVNDAGAWPPEAKAILEKRATDG